MSQLPDSLSVLADSLKLGMAVPAAAIAMEAGALIRGYYERGVETEYKGDVDLVTEADRASEKLIVEKLKETFPKHGIFGEEGTRSDGGGVPLVCGSAGWNDEFRARLSVLLRVAGPGASAGGAEG